MSLLLADYLEANLCERLGERFVPIADEHVAAPRGQAPPVGGRWWIRGCRAERTAGVLHLTLSGPGWLWADEAKSGFRLRQYVLFQAGVRLVGVPDAHYDATRRLASLWFSPLSTEADGHGLGPVATTADHFGTQVLDVVTFGWARSRADDAARREVDERVRARFAEKLRSGFTVTYHVALQQLDFRLGALGDGEEPLRPLLDGRPWLANERQILRPEPGGVHLLGPFDPAVGAALDVHVESGPGVRLWTECVDVTRERLSDLDRGEAPPSAPARAKAVGKLAPGRHTVAVAMPQCPWYLLTAADEGETSVVIRVRGKPSAVLLPPD